MSLQRELIVMLGAPSLREHPTNPNRTAEVSAGWYSYHPDKRLVQCQAVYDQGWCWWLDSIWDKDVVEALLRVMPANHSSTRWEPLKEVTLDAMLGVLCGRGFEVPDGEVISWACSLRVEVRGLYAPVWGQRGAWEDVDALIDIRIENDSVVQVREALDGAEFAKHWFSFLMERLNLMNSVRYQPWVPAPIAIQTFRRGADWNAYSVDSAGRPERSA